MHNKTGNIFNIQRFSTSDGNGIRTVVFLKGCPLRCAWCHNPESQKADTEIFFNPDNCMGCKMCEQLCTKKCHHTNGTTHFFDRTNCTACGKCAEGCLSGALNRCGETKSAEEIIDIVLKDRPFYEESGGGVTISGGEPLYQFDFTLSVLKLAKTNGLHTAVETSGFTDKDLSEMSLYTDLWLYDIKLLDEKEHIKYTGGSNKNILKNLHFLSSIGANIILRCPIIPDVNLNAQHFAELARLAETLKGIQEIHLEAYHPLGMSKATQLGTEQKYKNNSFLEASQIAPFAETLKSKLDIPVVII